LKSPAREGQRSSVILDTISRHDFFRLRNRGLTKVVETSPAVGETRAAVTREVILRFDGPLAEYTALTTKEFSVEASGRKILGRIELASDGRSATFFLGEPLPGDAQVEVAFDGTGLDDSYGQKIDPDGDGAPGGVFRYRYGTLSLSPVAETAVIGRVFASEVVRGVGIGTNTVNRPLQGVTITVDGSEEGIRTETDGNGNFTLSPVPAGEFFVHVDGRTARGSDWPSGAYYPVVGKAWRARPGVSTNLAGPTGEIYLPLIVPGTLQNVSMNEDTVVTFPPEVLRANPALAGVSILVPANSLFSDSGARGGQVGIAPVPPDRLPEALPAGLRFPLVITIQTDGPSNFGQPVPVRFPNLPDPVTGQPLAPGEESALWSFNHDTGRWEIQGPMTVTADGLFVESDPGVGVRQPGWHGTSPAVPTCCDPIRKEEKKEKDCDEFSNTWKSAALRAVAEAFTALPGEGNYGRDHLERFLDGNGSSVTYGEGSGPANDVQKHPTFESWNQQIERQLELKIIMEVRANPDDPFVPNYDDSNEFLPLDFYSESAPGITSQLAAGFGGVGRPEVGVRNVFITKNADGSYDYIADFDYNIEDEYSFDAQDASLEGPNGWAKDLQDCGEATPFNTRIQFRHRVVGNYRPRGQLLGQSILRAAAQNPHVNPSISAKGFSYLGQGFSESKVISTNKSVVVIQPDGSHRQSSTTNSSIGTHFFVIQDLENGAVLQRGETAGSGIAHINLILPPNRRFRQYVLNPADLSLGITEFRTPSSGTSLQLPDIILGEDAGLDSDQDGLSANAEFVMGTNPAQPDTDGDGIRDGAEVLQGSNPTDGLPTRLGVIGSTDAVDSARDIAIEGDLAFVADGDAGLGIYNIFNGLNPVRIAQLNLNGPATRVSIDGDLAAVLAGNLLCIDVSDPSTPQILHTISFPQSAPQSVVVVGQFAYVSSVQDLTVVDMRTGSILGQFSGGARNAYDLAYAGGVLAVLTSTSIECYNIDRILPVMLGQVSHRRGISDGSGSRIFNTGTLVHFSHFDGYDTFDISNPTAPVKVGASTLVIGTYHAVADNGNGRIICSFSRRSSDWPVGIFDSSNPSNTDRILLEFSTGGRSSAIAIHHGLAYATDDNGIKIINYLPFDTQGVPPAIQLRASPAGGATQIEENSQVRINAAVSDDVQIRSVEFYLDGILIATDGNFPFEKTVPTPARTANKTELVFRAKATDTGGNSTWSANLVVPLSPAANAFDVVGVLPSDGSVNFLARSIGLLLNSALDLASIRGDSLTLVEPGSDDQFGTEDDRSLTNGLPQTLINDSVLLLTFPDELPPNRYRASFNPPLRDTKGRSVTQGRTWEFRTTSTSFPGAPQVFPAASSTQKVVNVISLVFRESVSQSSINANSVKIVEFGPDGLVNTADDIPVSWQAIVMKSLGKVADIQFSAPLPYGKYLIQTTSDIKDFSGQGLAMTSTQFVVADVVRPQLLNTSPSNYAWVVEDLYELRAHFTEAIALPSVSFINMPLRASGPDGLLGTSDDLDITHGTFQILNEGRTIQLAFDQPLLPERYQWHVTTNVTDLVGNRLEIAPATTFSIPFFTTVSGRAVLPDGTPAAGAHLRIHGLRTNVVAGTDGAFSFPQSFLRPGVVHSVIGILTNNGVEFLGRSATLQPNHKGSTDAGTITLHPSCPPAFEENIFTGMGTPASVQSLLVWNDGSGPALIAGLRGGINDTNFVGVYRWTGTRWDLLGERFFSPRLLPSVNALAVFDDGSGPALYAGGQFQAVGAVAATNIARWNGTSWQPVGLGLADLFGVATVNALQVFNDGSGPALYAGGSFTRAGGLTVQNIARWSGAGWSQVGSGLGGPGFGPQVHAFTEMDSGGGRFLVAGGDFRLAGSTVVSNIARWNGAEWSGFGDGLGGRVQSLAVYPSPTGAQLIAGGSFETAGGQPANRIAAWNGTSWSPLGNGVTGGFSGSAQVLALLPSQFGNQPVLIAAGNFAKAGEMGQDFGIVSVAQWNGQTWTALSGTIEANFGVGGTISALALFNQKLVVGGNFESASESNERIPASRIALWNGERPAGERWVPLGGGVSSIVEAVHETQLGANRLLFVGGSFTHAGTNRVNEITYFDGVRFHPMGTGLDNGSDFTPVEARAITAFQDAAGPSVVVAGRFDTAGGIPSTNIARWNGSAWSALGEGLSGFGGGRVNALAVIQRPGLAELYAAGQFSGTANLNNVARWDGAQWQPLGRGLSGEVDALAVGDDGTGVKLFAGGNLNFVQVSSWDGHDWKPLGAGGGAGLNGRVRALAFHDDGSGPALFVAGEFGQNFNGRKLDGVAKWNGSEWIALGGGLSDGSSATGNALTSFDDGAGPVLAVGGRFQLGPREAQIVNFAIWDGSAWSGRTSPVGGGQSSGIRSLHAGRGPYGPALYGGGLFYNAGSSASQFVSRWQRTAGPCR